jgi:hypothetical protein
MGRPCDDGQAGSDKKSMLQNGVAGHRRRALKTA